MAVNNDGHLLDSSGNVAVAFEWGNLPMQPNDDRADGTPTITTTVGGDQNVSWTHYSKINSARLNFALGNHSIIESGWNGFPAYTAGDAGEQPMHLRMQDLFLEQYQKQITLLVQLHLMMERLSFKVQLRELTQLLLVQQLT
jgi:hypothetical protein